MNDKYNVIYFPEAKEDLRNIYRYIAIDLFEPKIAENQVNRIRDSIKKLNSLPERHQCVEWEPWCSLGMRHYSVDNFVVYYLVKKELKIVAVVRIFYGGRNIEQIIKGLME